MDEQRLNERKEDHEIILDEKKISEKKLTKQETKKQKMMKMPKQLECKKCNKTVWTNYAYKHGVCSKWSTFLFFVFGGCCCLCFIPICNEDFKEIHHTCPRCKETLLIIKPFTEKSQ